MTMTKDKITADTVVSGAEFRDFYQNHWPRDWFVEDMYFDFENDHGEFIMPDDARRKLGDFGWAGWQGQGDAPNGETSIPIAELYARVMGGKVLLTLATFKVDPSRLDELIKAAEALGAEKV